VLRRLLTLLSAASLVLCVATCVLWVRSYRKSDAVVLVGPSGHHGVQWVSGLLLLGSDDAGGTRRELRVDSWDAGGADARFGSGRLARLGFASERVASPGVSAWRCSTPLWSVAAVLSALAARAAIASAATRRRARRTGLCPACGYDLRASPERCPECGTAPAAADV
jgi:hypothetical protein